LCAARPAELLNGQPHAQCVESCAAEVFGDKHAEQAEGCHLAHRLGVELGALVELGGMRLQLRSAEGVHRGAPLTMLRG
jgi:hypothetical protein